ncbi:flagellar hook-basal body complex protein FliE [Microbacterium sp.]|uniref:flagellar hook-basal body complex protein FliE n=1 Tax=Microbacterium sp. TaxID=51671 RepID=UPI003A94BC4F
MSAVPAVGAVTSALPASAPVADAPAAPDGGSAFATSLASAVDQLSALQSTSNALSVAAISGDLNDIHSAMIASTRAAVTLELVAAVRNKGVDAFNDIMRMQA